MDLQPLHAGLQWQPRPCHSWPSIPYKHPANVRTANGTAWRTMHHKQGEAASPPSATHVPGTAEGRRCAAPSQ